MGPRTLRFSSRGKHGDEKRQRLLKNNADKLFGFADHPRVATGGIRLQKSDISSSENDGHVDQSINFQNSFPGVWNNDCLTHREVVATLRSRKLPFQHVTQILKIWTHQVIQFLKIWMRQSRTQTHQF